MTAKILCRTFDYVNHDIQAHNGLRQSSGEAALEASELSSGLAKKALTHNISTQISASCIAFDSKSIGSSPSGAEPSKKYGAQLGSKSSQPAITKAALPCACSG
jgi:hypothetical protein